MTAVAFETVLLMFAVLAAVAVIAKRLNIAPSILLVVAGVGIACALAKGIMRARNGNSESDLGCVSHQWLAEHRLAWMSDAQR